MKKFYEKCKIDVIEMMDVDVIVASNEDCHFEDYFSNELPTISWQ